MEQGLWGPTHWLVVSAGQGWLAPGQDSQGPSRCAGGQCRPFEVRSPVERPQGLPRPFWEEASGEDSHAEPSVHWTRLRIRRDQASGESGTGPGRTCGAGRERTRPGAPAGVVSASADLPASVSICAMGRARKPVTETQRSQSMFRAPGRAHLAQLQRADSEECLARGEPRGPLWRSGMSSAA